MPRRPVEPGTATPIATGGMLPRGADAVVMVEHARIDGDDLVLIRPVAPAGERQLRRDRHGPGRAGPAPGDRPDLARDRRAGRDRPGARSPWSARPRVAILSTGDEIIAPGDPRRPASVYDANATLLADAVRELGGEPVPLGIVGDDETRSTPPSTRGLASADLVLLSGGTSKGAGDLSYRVLARRSPGIVVHGVALKPGKPICLGAVGDDARSRSCRGSRPRRSSPSTSSSPRCSGAWPGSPPSRASREIAARLPVRFNSERGRTEYLLVNLVAGPGRRRCRPTRWARARAR